MQTEDQQLLDTYIRDKSEAAFREIVDRYGQLAYSAAYRCLQDHHLAEDAAQATFIVLIRKATEVRAKKMLSGWLWRTATFCAKNLQRQRVAREQRERRESEEADAETTTVWERIAPELDAALGTLSPRIREALIGHYLQGKSRQELADTLGLSVDTIHKRIQRGIDRLRAALGRRGFAVTSTMLLSWLGSRTAEAVSPAACASMHAVACGTVTGATAPTHAANVLAEGVLKMMAWNKIKVTASCVGAVLACVGLSAALATTLIDREYRMPEEVRYEQVQYAPGVREADDGWILDFYPDSWLKHDLSGTWKIKVFRTTGPREEADQSEPYPYSAPNVNADGWPDIRVPRSLGKASVSSPRGKPRFRGAAWYRRSFALPAGWAARMNNGWRVLLRLEAIGGRDRAWAAVNGQTVGEDFHGMAGFQFDVTERVRTDADNTVAVRILGGGAHRSQHARCGLWQPVRLVCVPPVYAKRVLVASSVNPPALRVKATIVNHEPPGTHELEALLQPWKANGERPRVISLGSIELKPGENTKTFSIKAPGAKLWSPDEPNLYLLSLRTRQGAELARERIGFRTFEAKNGDFCLNGNKIKLMGFQFSHMKNLPAAENGNHVRKMLHGMKQANVNFGRPHVGEGSLGGMTRTAYNLCDEVGVLIYDEWNRVHSGLYNTDRLREFGEEFKEWIYQTHNHASCVLWDHGGNEIYSRDVEMVPVLNYLYAVLESADMQRRPKTSSSGRLTWERLERFPQLEKADFADSHRYNGYHSGSYQEFIDLFQRLDRAAKKRYGPNTPTINCEWGFPGDQARYRANTVQVRDLYMKDPWGLKEKRKYIEYLTSETPEIGGYLRAKQNWAGGRVWSTDPLGLWERKAVIVKRYLEVFRRSGDVIDGGHFNSPIFCALIHGKRGHEGMPRDSYPGFKVPHPALKHEFFKTPAFYAWRRAYSPTFICLDIHDKNTFAGHLWKSTVHIMNDTHKPAGAAKAVLQVRSPRGRLLHQQEIWRGHVGPYLRQTTPVQLALSSAWPTGRYQLELYLLDPRGRHLSDNHYVLDIAGPDGLRTAIRPRGKVGLYEPEKEPNKDGKPRPTTASILRSLRIPYTQLKDARQLKNLDALLIGFRSVGPDLAKLSPAITKWVRDGGRLLCFEQNKAGQLPFLPEVKVMPSRYATFTELAVPKHPLFAGLDQVQFDDWNEAKGLIFHNVLTPLNEGLLSVGPTGRFGKDLMHMVSASYAIGKGEIVLSQYSVTWRYGKDSVATRLTQNLLSYVLTQPRSALSLPFETTATAKAGMQLSNKNARYIDLRGAANARIDEFAKLPRGVSTLNGDIPFVLSASNSDGTACIVLRGTNDAGRPQRAGPIPIGKQLDKLYLLHYATWANGLPEGEPVFTVRIRYTDGREQNAPMRNRLETADWWNPPDPKRAMIVHTEGQKNLFLTQIPLAGGTAAVQSITFESAGKATPFILAATGAAGR